MPNLANLTDFAALDLPSIDRDGAELLLLVVAGRFRLPRPGKSSVAPLRPTTEQVPPPPGDVFWGEPGLSSVRYEGQSAYTRAGTDIYLNGHACAPAGQKAKEVLVRLRVGTLSKEVLAIGNRTWVGGLLGVTPSAPEPFEKMPLHYEYAFGGSRPAEKTRGAADEPRNPAGRGFYRDALEATGQPLPNLEDPKQRIGRWGDRPTPAGFGPINRAWLPRRKLAGTFDEKWVEERAPLWPKDFAPAFFQAAAPGLIVTPHLQGGEPVSLEGVSPDGPFNFELPRRRIQVKSIFLNRTDRRLLTLDGVLFEPDDASVTLIWRAAVPLPEGLKYHQTSVVREAETWEKSP